MSLGPFWVGERPADPLVLTLANDAGTPIDLNEYSTVTLVGDGLPAGSLSVVNAGLGKVEYVFSAAWASAGVVSIRARLQNLNGDIDYIGPVDVTVQLAPTTTNLMVTMNQVAEQTGQLVSNVDISRAQSLVSLALGADVFDPEWRALLSARDLHWLGLAIGYQAADRATDDAAEIPEGIQSVSNDGMTIVYAGSRTISSIAGLSKLTQMALSRLSWRRNRSIEPTLGCDRYPVWDNDNAFFSPKLNNAPQPDYVWSCW